MPRDRSRDEKAQAAAEAEAEKTKVALGRAEAGEAAAKKEALRASTVLGFVDRALSSSYPHDNQGPDYRVRDLLEEFDRDLGGSLAGEPDVAASVHQMIGSAFLRIGLPQKAEPHIGAARSLTQDAFGEGSIENARCLVDAAQLLHDKATTVARSP